MDRKKVFTGLFVLLLILGVFWGTKKGKTAKKLEVPVATPGAIERIEEAFNLSVPTDVDRAELKKIGEIDGLGVATRKFVNGIFSLTILADLPDATLGDYSVTLEKENGEKLNLGVLRVEKGGYVLDFTGKKDYSEYKKVIVLFKSEKILEGTFQK